MRYDLHKEIVSNLLEEAGLKTEIDIDHLTSCLIRHFESVEESDRDVIRLGRKPMAEITQEEYEGMKQWQEKAARIIIDTFALAGIQMTRNEAFERIANARV
jgi:hypothetical protein